MLCWSTLRIENIGGFFRIQLFALIYHDLLALKMHPSILIWNTYFHQKVKPIDIELEFNILIVYVNNKHLSLI